MKDLNKLETGFLQPSEDLIHDLTGLSGDLVILGAGGKMGPGLSILARNALNASGKSNRVIAVSRFSDKATEQKLNHAGVETIGSDLLNSHDLDKIPVVPNIIYMAGRKFGTSGNEPMTWAMNAFLPGKIAEKFRDSRIVVFSTGNVYPFMPVSSGGAVETDIPSPVGEYAQSCLGRERMFEYFASVNKTPLLIYRLNYAIDFHYGVMVEIARSVMEGKEIDLRTGYANMIWQGDANEYALRCLNLCSNPPAYLNVTGPETVSVRELATEFGKRFGKEPLFQHHELETALLSNSSKMIKLLGPPKVALNRMIDLVSEWILEGGSLYDKPTHFQEREGTF